jgi:hypothetical protein
MRAAVTDRADVAGSTRVTSAKIDRAINSSIKRLHNKIMECSEEQSTVIGTVLTEATKPYATMPADFLILRAAEWVIGGSNTPQPIGRFQLQERTRYETTNGWHVGTPISYRLMRRDGTAAATAGRQSIWFAPTPTAVHTVTVYYVPQATTLTADGDFYDAWSGADEWVIWDAAISLMIQEESDVRDAVVERDRVWTEQLLPLFATQDQAHPDRVVDVDSAASGFEEFGA